MNNELDPEFLAALPPDIQAEVLAQQRVAQAAARHAASASSADMDSASIIATFPPDLREEVSAGDEVCKAVSLAFSGFQLPMESYYKKSNSPFSSHIRHLFAPLDLIALEMFPGT